jgi:AcrR family transcriptional regulator
MPISDCEVRDPRVRRTRQLLQDAFRNLLRSRGLDEISVQEITEAATVNRATFYDHYTDKFALLEEMVAGGFHAFLHK